MKINLGLVATSLTAAVVMASTDPNAADMSAADEQTFLKENASNVGLLNGALASIAELKADMAAMKSEHAAEIAAVKSEMKSKDAEHDAIIASVKTHRHGVVPSNLRRRTQEEMSMSMPATANIWNSGGDEEPEENFFSGWDTHKESCCDHVTDLEGRVSKLEDEVGDLNQCVDYQELYSPDGESPPLPTCKIGLGKPYVAIDGEFRVTTSTYNEDEGRVNVNTKDFDVDAQDSVTVKAMKTATVEAHDIDLKSKNNIEAHAGNDIQIKADMDVYITADESSGSVGDVKIAGENVNVDADKSVNMAAKEHVMVDAGHNVTVNAGDTVTVEADEDVKIVGQDIHIAAEASVDVSAKEHVMVNADDDVKISGDNVDVNANDDVKIVGGESVYVVATNASIAMTAGETVTVEADDYVKIAGQDIHIAAEASVDVSAKKNVMVNADHNVTVMAGDTIAVEANDDVKIVGKDVHIDAHDDIILKSKNDIMAHAENNAVIKADNDVHITADANNGADGDVKIAGQDVHVKADDDVKIMANDDVIVDAAVDNSDNGNVIIEGVKYFPQKQEICSKDGDESFGVYFDGLIGGESPDSRIELLNDEGHLAFGNITVGNGPGDVVVDIVASTAQLFFYYQNSLSRERELQFDPFTFVNGGSISLSVELNPSGGVGTIHPVPDTRTYLRDFQNDELEWDFLPYDGTESSVNSTNPAKLIFPEVPPGDYDVKVRFFVELEAVTEVFDDCCTRRLEDGPDDQRRRLCCRRSLEDGDDAKRRLNPETFAESETELTLGPHYISVSVIDASHEQCGNITWSPTASPSSSPTPSPTASPTASPTTDEPTVSPSQSPTTDEPTGSPTTKNPTGSPTTDEPTVSPSQSPTTDEPTGSPTTKNPTGSPTTSPTAAPISCLPFNTECVPTASVGSCASEDCCSECCAGCSYLGNDSKQYCSP